MSNRTIVEHALARFADPAQRDEYFNLYSEDIWLHGYEGVQPGLASVRQYYAGLWSAFPDARVHAEDWVEQDDKVVVRFVMTGTHRGPLFGIAPTGKPITVAGMTILHFQHGKCVERWSITNSLSLLAQLGASLNTNA